MNSSSMNRSRRVKPLIPFALLLILALSPAVEAQVYKCTQGNGTTQYSDRQCGSDPEKIIGIENFVSETFPVTDEKPAETHTPLFQKEKEPDWFDNWKPDWSGTGGLRKNRLLWKFLLLALPLLIWWVLHMRYSWTHRWRDRRRRSAWGWGIAGAVTGSFFDIAGFGGLSINGAIPGALIGFFVASNFMKGDYIDVLRQEDFRQSDLRRPPPAAPRNKTRQPSVPNYYDLLQISRTAGPEVIQGAFRYLAQKWHPDKNPGNKEEAERVFKALNEAYAVLSDPRQKKEYDALLNAAAKNDTHNAQTA